MEGVTQLAVKTNLLFTLIDVVETLLMEMERDMRLRGRAMQYSMKRDFNTTIHGVRRLKAELKHIGMNVQEAFGNDADILYALLLLIVDRVGADDLIAFKLYNYIKAMPSSHHLEQDIDERMVFGHVLEGKED